MTDSQSRTANGRLASRTGVTWATSLGVGFSVVLASSASADVKQALIYNAKRETSQQQGPTSLVEGSDGALYGTSKGSAGADTYGNNGSVFKLVPCADYPYRTLVPFSSRESVLHGMTEGKDGLLFGTQFAIQNSNSEGANGSAYKTTKAGKLELLRTFDGANGKNPSGPPLVTEDGTLYGVAVYGGITGQNSQGFGTLYKLAPDGTLGLVYDFGTDAGRNGGNPQTRLARDKDGNLYGTARTGGANMAGTVFKVTPDGKASALISFGGGSAGSHPSDLLLSRDGKTLYGKLHGGSGSVFSLTLDGKLSTLHAFTEEMDGAFKQWDYGNNVDPAGTLIEGKDGKLYGTAESGGPYMHGTVYRIDPADGTFEVIYAFKGTSDGGTPVALLQASDGHLYGTALSGGSNSDVGGVFKIALDGNLDAPACPAGTNTSAPTAGSGGGSAPSRSANAGAGGSPSSDAPQDGESSPAGGDAGGRSGSSSAQAGRGSAGKGGSTGSRSSGATANAEGGGAAGSASMTKDRPTDAPEDEKSGCMVSSVGAARDGAAPLAWLALALGVAGIRRGKRKR